MLILATAIRSSVLLFSSKLQVTNIIGDQEREREREGERVKARKKWKEKKTREKGKKKTLF